jgi:hypothetical protein
LSAGMTTSSIPGIIFILTALLGLFSASIIIAHRSKSRS